MGPRSVFYAIHVPLERINVKRVVTLRPARVRTLTTGDGCPRCNVDNHYGCVARHNIEDLKLSKGGTRRTSLAIRLNFSDSVNIAGDHCPRRVYRKRSRIGRNDVVKLSCTRLSISARSVRSISLCVRDLNIPTQHGIGSPRIVEKRRGFCGTGYRLYRIAALRAGPQNSILLGNAHLP